MGYPERVLGHLAEKNPHDNFSLSLLLDHMSSESEEMKKLFKLKQT